VRRDGEIRASPGLQRVIPFQDKSSQTLSTVNRQSGILVIVHSTSFLETSGLVTFSFSDPDRMDNLLKLHM
jgi:hypothetical protein